MEAVLIRLFQLSVSWGEETEEWACAEVEQGAAQREQAGQPPGVHEVTLSVGDAANGATEEGEADEGKDGKQDDGFGCAVERHVDPPPELLNGAHAQRQLADVGGEDEEREGGGHQPEGKGDRLHAFGKCIEQEDGGDAAGDALENVEGIALHDVAPEEQFHDPTDALVQARVLIPSDAVFILTHQ